MINVVHDSFYGWTDTWAQWRGADWATTAYCWVITCVGGAGGEALAVHYKGDIVNLYKFLFRK